MNLEQHNHRQIERLNQRGGRTLSIVDLIQAGTLTVEMAACAFRAVARGASVLTGARPSGAGKTTLLAALLNLLPPDVPIVTVDGPEVIREGLAAAPEPSCYLVHEIGAGDWFGYLWGQDVARYLSLIDGPRRIASCLHADTLDELTGILRDPPLGVRREVIGRVGLVLFIHVARLPQGYARRVAAFYESDDAGGHRLLYTWDRADDKLVRAAEPADSEGLAPYAAFLQRLVDEGQTDTQAVRRKVVQFYLAGPR